uniref:Uncharacterized protein n=1 Tax=viral metagenome TaxID=1070528 RepID=A0A6M3JDS2_9ZZZZ
MFCILHQYCLKSVANGHCSIFASTERVRRHGKCNFAVLPENKPAGKTTAKKVNPLKASKRRK